jgi:hypothetical protein
MSVQQPSYKLSIEAILPKKLVEDKIFEVTYKIRNVGAGAFHGGKILVVASLPSNAGHVR